MKLSIQTRDENVEKLNLVRRRLDTILERTFDIVVAGEATLAKDAVSEVMDYLEFEAPIN